MAHVDLGVHFDQRAGRTGACRGPRAFTPPGRHRLVGTGHIVACRPPSPTRFRSRRHSAPDPRCSPRDNLPSGPVLRRCRREPRLRALRIGRREQDRHRPAFGIAEQDRAFAFRRVHHRAHIVHPRFQVGHHGRSDRPFHACRSGSGGNAEACSAGAGGPPSQDPGARTRISISFCVPLPLTW